MRDSKAPSRGVLSIPAGSFTAFVAALRSPMDRGAASPPDPATR
ncbi:DUF397 domain-containing protein [Streptomyces gilvus]